MDKLFSYGNSDIVFASTITFGIFSTIKAFKTERNIFFFSSGLWIGFAVMLKTYLTSIPFLAILPFLIRSKIIKNKWFWIGTFLGFFPFLVWSYKVIQIYGFQVIQDYIQSYYLSLKTILLQIHLLYLWNLTIKYFPWCIFSTIGFLILVDSKQTLKILLVSIPINSNRY